MSGQRNDGGPAFPFPSVYGGDGNGIYEGSHGMSLRDWFAGQALSGSLEHVLKAAKSQGAERDDAIQTAAELAYDAADAMLAARTPARAS